MQRAQIVEANKPLRLSTTDIPSPPEGGVVIKTTYSGICHSDLHQWEDEVSLGNNESMKFTDVEFYNFPITPGHEIAGNIYSIGDKQPEDVHHSVGDRVVIYSWAACGHCGYCDKNCDNKCKERLRCYGFGIPGGYSSYVVVPRAKHALKLPDSIPFDVGCMLPCSGITTYNAVTTIQPTVESFVGFEGQACVLIVGAGGLGLWSLQIAKAVLPKCTKIVVADIGKDKLQVAIDHGCDDTVLWNPDMSEDDLIALTKSKGRDGFDAIIDYVNTSVTSKRVFKCLRPNGMLAMVGLFGGCGQYSLPSMVLWSNKVTGVFVGELRHLQELIKLVETQKLIPPPLNYYKLDQVTEALSLLKRGGMRGRGIIKFD